jgi:hypothetical protein
MLEKEYQWAKCVNRQMLNEQIAECVRSYAVITASMLQIPDVRTGEYAEGSQNAARLKAEIRFLKNQLRTHCQEHCCAKLNAKPMASEQKSFRRESQAEAAGS